MENAETMTAGAATRDAGAAPMPFGARLDLAMDRVGSLLCVGLDPLPERIEEPVADFCRRVIDATWRAAVAFKPNIAFFEALGPEGLRELITVIRHCPDGRLMILDAKRGDIGSTAQAYARAVFEVYGADAVTLSPYLGGDSLAPFLADPARGAFVLCHTSNPGAAELQTLDVGGRPLYLEVARRARGWNAAGNLGLVVGATYPEALAATRAEAPELPILVPGVGAQGGALEDAVRAGRDRQGRGILINSSRDIIFSGDPAGAALRLRDTIDAARARA